MTEPTTIVPEQDERRDTLWVSDGEIVKRMGCAPKIAWDMLRVYDEQNAGFPQKQKQWGNRRYWPAVRAYLDRIYGFRMDAPQPRSNSHVR